MVLTHFIANDGSHIFFNGLQNKYLILSSNGTNNGESIEVVKELPSFYNDSNILSSSKISCIIGIIRLKLCSYIILADKHSITGSILNNDIAFIESFKILPLNSKNTRSSNEETHYVKLIQNHLKNATLYYSIDSKYDLTNSLQRQFTVENLEIDERFWWNKYLSADLIENKAEGFITPIIYGYFKSHSTIFNGKSLEFALLTRRSVSRAGTRYFRRGIDIDGNVANFNETEQIFTASNNHHVYSIVQTRGSVPVYWAEINNLKYKPNLVISSRSSLDATAAHFKQQVDLYGDNLLVNLVNQKGYEKPVKDAYESAVESLPEKIAQHIHYIYFDFHHECKNMKYHRINLLLDQLISLGYTSDNFFEIDLNTKQIKNLQNKVVRTNCMDCLDRTNVVQGTIGRWFLQNQLYKSGYLVDIAAPFEQIDKRFNLFFQNFWADNADAVSCAYSGTGALKTDFTRLGKRTYKGGLNDFLNSVTRYYKNNLADGSRQDSYDLFLGKFKPYQDSITSPFIDKRPPYIQLLPYLMGTSILILLAILYYPIGSLFDMKNILIISLCVLFNIRNFVYLKSHGYQFVDWPKLVNLDYLTKQDIYDGTGKLTGIEYKETDDFKLISKKRN
ncbi:unnamed protein product [Candida verbasci]|uniref:SAC domain-containing protein n=1 Tax=Candida verbasci TaxID=1227364 RepID=A0A9W4X9A9_9ASCO|nr:unnamed protein product [Candida verbasci]